MALECTITSMQVASIFDLWPCSTEGPNTVRPIPNIWSIFSIAPFLSPLYYGRIWRMFKKLRRKWSWLERMRIFKNGNYALDPKIRQMPCQQNSRGYSTTILHFDDVVESNWMILQLSIMHPSIWKNCHGTASHEQLSNANLLKPTEGEDHRSDPCKATDGPKHQLWSASTARIKLFCLCLEGHAEWCRKIYPHLRPHPFSPARDAPEITFTSESWHTCLQLGRQQHVHSKFSFITLSNITF